MSQPSDPPVLNSNSEKEDCRHRGRSGGARRHEASSLLQGLPAGSEGQVRHGPLIYPRQRRPRPLGIRRPRGSNAQRVYEIVHRRLHGQLPVGRPMAISDLQWGPAIGIGEV